MPSPIRIRPGVVGDAEAISKLAASFLPEFAARPDHAGTEAFLRSVSVEAERIYLASVLHRFIVAEQDGKLVGVIGVHDQAHIQQLFVAPSHQGKGVARRLWNQARQEIEAVQKPQRYTVNSSPKAVPVYRSFGFARTGDKETKNGVQYFPMRLDLM